MPSPNRFRSLRTSIGVVLATATLLTVASCAPSAGDDSATQVTAADYHEAATLLSDDFDAAQEVLTASENQVFDDANRLDLTSTVQEVQEYLLPLEEWLSEDEGLVPASPSGLTPALPADLSEVLSLRESLHDRTVLVQEDVAIWSVMQAGERAAVQAQQVYDEAVAAEAARVAAEQAAAEAEAARVAAQQQAQAAQNPVSPAAATPGHSTVAYSFNSAGAGNQATIDACSGFADTTNWIGVPAFGVHWHCGGSAIASLPVGSVIQVNNGQYAGLWRMEGLAYTLSHSIHTVADIRHLGGLQIQTCLQNNSERMGYFLFSRVG